MKRGIIAQSEFESNIVENTLIEKEEEGKRKRKRKRGD